MEKLWTVVRFPDGSWSYGGRLDSPEYALCEKWSTFAVDGKTAVKLTQRRRQNERKRAARISAKQEPFPDQQTTTH